MLHAKQVEDVRDSVEVASRRQNGPEIIKSALFPGKFPQHDNLCMELPSPPQQSQNWNAGESYNVGTGITTSFNEIADMVKSISKSDSKIVHVKNPFKNYQMFTQADMKKHLENSGSSHLMG